MTTLSREPIYVTLVGRQREVVFNLNSAILLRDLGFETQGMTEKVEGGFRVKLEAFRAYLYAGLQKDARAKGETLSIEEAGDLVNDEDIPEVLGQLNRALLRFYGQEPSQGEAAATAASGKSRGRSKNGSASSAAR